MEGITSQGFSFDLPKGNSSIIKVIGVGGGGNNALKHMYEKGIHGVDFIICNTDSQTLDNNPVANKVQLGLTMTEGLGAGADPEVGEKAAIESIDDIKASLGQNTKMVFITAGMGGGTGTGAAPVIAKVAKEQGILTVGIVTVPFSFEGRRRLDQAEAGLEKLRNNVDSLIVINNDKLRQQFGNLGFKQGFSKADEVLTNAAKGMAEVITGYFDVNIDFRDAKSVLQNSGTALMSTGTASGENKAEEAVRKALDSPLLNDNKITGAKNVLLLIRSGNEEATMDEIGLINDYIQKEAGNTADIIFGVGTDEELGDAISVLVIATGFSNDNLKHAGPTEKITINLHDKVSKQQRTSPFLTKNERAEAPKQVEKESKNFFRLDDDSNANNPQFSATQQAAAPQIIEEETPTEVHYFDEEPDEDSQEEYNLFTFSDFEDERQSFTFEVEDKPVSHTNSISEEEKPVQVNFSLHDADEVEEEIIPEPFVRKQTVQIVENHIPETPKKEEVVPQQPYEEIEEIQDQPVNNSFSEATSEFTFFTRTESQEEKIQERRNKLKEFNSRYQASEMETNFDKIPAYKRKNINIDSENASDQRINSYLSENERGQVYVRENRFLNKDVD